jgi:hypothetical protein
MKEDGIMHRLRGACAFALGRSHIRSSWRTFMLIRKYQVSPTFNAEVR